MGHGSGGPEAALLGLCFWAALFLFVAVVTAADPGTASGFPSLGRESCNYTVIIETTCTKGAGTSDHVSLRFGDATSNEVLVHPLKAKKHARSVDGEDNGLTVVDDMPRVPFKECETDVFEVSGDCVQSPVCYLYLRQRGGDRWRPGRAQVLVSGKRSLSSGTFYFRRFLPQNVWHGFDGCGGKVTPFGVRQIRKVFYPRHG